MVLACAPAGQPGSGSLQTLEPHSLLPPAPLAPTAGAARVVRVAAGAHDAGPGAQRVCSAVRLPPAAAATGGGALRAHHACCTRSVGAAPAGVCQRPIDGYDSPSYTHVTPILPTRLFMKSSTPLFLVAHPWAPQRPRACGACVAPWPHQQHSRAKDVEVHYRPCQPSTCMPLPARPA
jgi:hypothetical protein